VLALEIAFWASAALIVHTHVLYPLVIRAIAALRSRPVRLAEGYAPPVTLVIACHDEEAVIERKIANALELDYPQDRLEIIVACDGCSDRTVPLALDAARASDRVAALDLPRGGKVRTQDRAVMRAQGEILAFSDANSFWEPGALRELIAPFADPDVGYVCGEVSFEQGPGATNQEGTYWRYEMAVRRAESAAGSVTAGNGAIYATRSSTYVNVDPRMGHDLSFPFNIVRRGHRAVFAPGARARERMVPDVRGEFRRKRRMMSHAWPIVLRGGLLNPRGYGPLYSFEILSHRALRYATPFLHAVALGANLALVVLGAGPVYAATLAVQGAALLLGLLSPLVRSRPTRLAAYYWLTTLSIALGMWDWIRTGTPATWEKAEGTR